MRNPAGIDRPGIARRGRHEPSHAAVHRADARAHPESEPRARGLRQRKLARAEAGHVRECIADVGIEPYPLEAEAAVLFSGKLYERGVFVTAIRPPTVPPGTSRIGLSLTSRITREEISRLVTSLEAAVKSLPALAQAGALRA